MGPGSPAIPAAIEVVPESRVDDESVRGIHGGHGGDSAGGSGGSAAGPRVHSRRQQRGKSEEGEENRQLTLGFPEHFVLLKLPANPAVHSESPIQGAHYG